MPELVLGPLLRHVDAAAATVWVETSEPCTVRVRAGDACSEERTFTVHGHHYALLDVGIEGPVAYEVELDDRRVWPEEGLPPSVIHPLTRLDRLIFGSCRTSVPHEEPYVRTHGPDVLRAYGLRLMESPDERPDLILLLGDQVYADELTPDMKEFIAGRRDEGPEEVVDFEEYAELYRQAWSDPPVRWLMATVPTLMIFDDHDVRDDWNTSNVWREQMAEVPWWERRIVSALGSYYVYQHLGNLPPAERAADPVLAALRAGGGDEALDTFARRADKEPDSVRWSYHRDLGGTRLIVLDSRSARVLEPGRRRMLDPGEWDWFDKHATGDFDHLLVGSSLPILLPAGIHHVESWNEAVCDGIWGRRAARWGERVRQFLDLEHWGAFRRSFEELAQVVLEVASGGRGRPPATVLLLSGDVHYSYMASVRRRGGGRVHQVVCSPIRNPLSRTLRFANIVASFGLAGVLGGVLARAGGLPRPPLRWRISKGPWFPNMMTAIDLAPGEATVTWFTDTGDQDAVRIRPEPPAAPR
ncbi:alkaline phosphatase D family protein [Microbispora sp. NBRC 16548]|uniref:alkaline phosphatase D family protein n=1 Tax=Microbispora sp. NBRC 16548 TaxID=3030994 RepID=UPI0024A331A8|nr:alkaline phosphatase D family protein [Microbispora sp. NBRC 16548]GLX06281.1 metallophosphatase [Microbispora sp. NBRC 16548]